MFTKHLDEWESYAYFVFSMECELLGELIMPVNFKAPGCSRKLNGLEDRKIWDLPPLWKQ